MAALSVALLIAGVAGAVGRPFGWPAWVAPGAAAGIDLVAGGATLAQAQRALDDLAQPVAFLLAAVPLAVLLDRLGFFAAAARVLTRGERSVAGLWILAAAVTTVLNLDAAVVLLTPLYVRIARRLGVDALSLAVLPLLACWLASSALPVSNLTNLIAVSENGATAAGFLSNLGLPSLVAVAVGWVAYRRYRGRGEVRALADPDGAVALDGGERRALRIGGVVVVVALAGFLAGRAAGVAAWEVAVGCDVLLLLVDRPASWRARPWRSIPLGTALVAVSLGVLATAVVGHLHVERLLGDESALGLARTAAVTAVGANVVNNLPAFLVVAPSLGPHMSPSLWAALIGVNMGPVLVVTGTLASLLWVDTLGRVGVPVRSREVTIVGVRVALPASAAALAAFLVLHSVGVR